MRFFTDEKYQNGSAFNDYENYCKLIWQSVPIGLKQICKDMLPPEFDSNMVYGLHDGRITKFEYDKYTNDTKVYYLIFDEQGNAHSLKATYKDSVCISQPSVAFIGNNMDCDIMCHEIAYSENNRLHHTLLFGSGEELKIEFSAFELED